MPGCKIDVEAAPHFLHLVEKLQRKYPHITDDLHEFFEAIERDFTTAAHARRIPRIPGLVAEVWKYRWKCSDQQKGTRGGMRVIAYRDSTTGTMYPLFIYVKAEQEDISPTQIAKAVRELREAIEPP